jgi:hypothetical protein
MWMQLLLAVLVAGTVVQSVSSVKYVVVETKQGKIKGVREDNDYGLGKSIIFNTLLRLISVSNSRLHLKE